MIRPAARFGIVTRGVLATSVAQPHNRFPNPYLRYPQRAVMTNIKLTVAFAAAMVLIVLSSNVLVQYPLSDWLTWGAITYPFSFLVVDLANRYHGPCIARR